MPYGTHVYRGIAHNFDVPTWDDASRRAATFFNKFLKETKARALDTQTDEGQDERAREKPKSAAAPKAGDARPKVSDAPTKGGSPQPKPGDAQPKSDGPQPIFIDARPVAADAPTKASSAPTQSAESSTKGNRVDPPAGDQDDALPPRS